MKRKKPPWFLKPVAWVLGPFVGIFIAVLGVAAVLGVGLLCCIGEQYSKHNTGRYPC